MVVGIMNIGDIVHLENTCVFSVNLYCWTFLSFPDAPVDSVLKPAVFCLAWQVIINSGLPRNIKSLGKNVLFFESGKLWVSDDNHETCKTSKSWIMAGTYSLTSLTDQSLILTSWSLCFKPHLITWHGFLIASLYLRFKGYS